VELSKATISSRIISYSVSKFLILKAFDQHNKVIIHSDNILFFKLDVQSPILGMQLQ